MFGDLNMVNSAKIKGLPMPTEHDEAATKRYVDHMKLHRIIDIDFDKL